ncbi:B12-binding domain-containing radical SAM protein [Vallitalea maricola]|uniref:Uncharacterized protein n=1 Tax=Vallitalea maricola TaxID=3074433 RepID=A0ACB5UET3_9FIRM|nr:hypothetical protein AN2V17_02920 [Vallitalea sp. AN17-2]
MLDAVLIYMNVVNGYITGAEYQLDSAYVSSYLRKNDVEVIQYINKDINNYHELINDLFNYKTDTYIFYINEYNYYISKVIINGLKACRKDNKIIAFGPVSNFIGYNLLDEVMVDICVLQEEPMTIYNLIDSCSLDHIDNIIYRKGTEIVEKGIRYYDYTLDDIGFPYSSGSVPIEELENVGLITSKGCYGNCAFCSYTKNRYLTHSIEGIIDELKYIKKYFSYSSLKVNFYDDCFSINNNRTKELCKEIINNKIKYTYWCCTRADLLSEELIDLMSEANFRNIVIGLETASNKVMSKLGKVVGRENSSQFIEKVRKSYKKCEEVGINPYISINFGLPFEKLEDAFRTIDYVKDKKMDNISVCFMTSFPDSRIFENSRLYDTHKDMSPTVLPYRTYYHNYDMGKIYNLLKQKNILNDIYIEQSTRKSKIVKDILYYYSGIPFTNRYSKFNNVFVKDDANDYLDFIDNNINMHGRIIRNNNKLSLSKDYLFCDDRKNIKYCIKEYDHTLETAYKSDKYVPSIISTRTKDNITNIQIDNLYDSKKFSITTRSLNSLQELIELENKAAEVMSKGYFTINDIKNGIINNACMFSGICTLSQFNRVTLSDEKVNLCINHGQVGLITDTTNQLVDNLSKQMEQNSSAECSNCKFYSKCSKCTFLPHFLNRKMFCEHVRCNPGLWHYLRMKNILYHYYTFNLFNIEGEDKIRFTICKDCNPGGSYSFKDEVVMFEYDYISIIYNLESNTMIYCTKDEQDTAKYLMGFKEDILFNDERYIDIILKLEKNNMLVKR